MISAATGALVSTVMLMKTSCFRLKKYIFDYHNLPYYILLGVLMASFHKLCENFQKRLNIISVD